MERELKLDKMIVRDLDERTASEPDTSFTCSKGGCTIVVGCGDTTVDFTCDCCTMASRRQAKR